MTAAVGRLMAETGVVVRKFGLVTQEHGVPVRLGDADAGFGGALRTMR